TADGSDLPAAAEEGDHRRRSPAGVRRAGAVRGAGETAGTRACDAGRGPLASGESEPPAREPPPCLILRAACPRTTTCGSYLRSGPRPRRCAARWRSREVGRRATLGGARRWAARDVGRRATLGGSRGVRRLARG